MLAKVCGAALQGIDAIRISIETLVEPGFSITLVGMPDKAVKESIQRVESAVNHSALEFPRRKILINMAPAEVRKEGAAYDLPLAVGILAADRKIPADLLDRYMIMGELSLDGSLLPVSGVLPMAILARQLGMKGFIVPEQNAREAAQQFAKDSDSKVGKMKTASQGQFSIDDTSSSTPFTKNVRVVSTIVFYLED